MKRPYVEALRGQDTGLIEGAAFHGNSGLQKKNGTRTES
jgi:hypothetical protein